MLEKERQRLSRPLTAAEREQALSALDASERLSDQLLDRRSGTTFPDSARIVRHMRKERTRHLS